MEVTLQEDANDLQEVVVTGYTTQREGRLDRFRGCSFNQEPEDKLRD